MLHDAANDQRREVVYPGWGEEDFICSTIPNASGTFEPRPWSLPSQGSAAARRSRRAARLPGFSRTRAAVALEGLRSGAQGLREETHSVLTVRLD